MSIANQPGTTLSNAGLRRARDPLHRVSGNALSSLRRSAEISFGHCGTTSADGSRSALRSNPTAKSPLSWMSRERRPRRIRRSASFVGDGLPFWATLSARSPPQLG